MGSMTELVAVLLDGGFVTKKLRERERGTVTADHVQNLVSSIMEKPPLAGKRLYRAYFYDAEPYERTETNPLDGSKIDFKNTSQAKDNRELLKVLDLTEQFAVRRGSIIMSGWKLRANTARKLSVREKDGGVNLAADDIGPDMKQKGVDIKIGLDIAWIALKRIVRHLVLVTGDADLVPAMKFARKEGLMIYIDVMGHRLAHPDLKVHSDYVL